MLHATETGLSSGRVGHPWFVCRFTYLSLVRFVRYFLTFLQFLPGFKVALTPLVLLHMDSERGCVTVFSYTYYVPTCNVAHIWNAQVM